MIVTKRQRARGLPRVQIFTLVRPAKFTKAELEITLRVLSGIKGARFVILPEGFTVAGGQ